MDAAVFVRGGVSTTSLESLEQLLLESDFGVPVTLRLVDEVEQHAKRGGVNTTDQFLGVLARGIESSLRAGNSDPALRLALAAPSVILVVGVNGAGKTTFIGKLAERLRRGGNKVMLAAGDTFRAGAIDQLRVWADRTGSMFVGAKAGADPAAVAFDAIDSAVARGADVLIVDTAGRLHTSEGLMEELRKVARVVAKRLPGAPHETLLVLDAHDRAERGTAGEDFCRGRTGVGARRHEARRDGAGRRRDRGARGDRRAGQVSRRRRGGRRSRGVRRDGVFPGAAERRVSASTESERRSAQSGGGRRLYLDTPVTYLKGVGPARADALRRLGITTAGDLLYHVPHRYEDASTVTPIKSLEPGMHGTVVGTVISKGVLPTRKGLRIFQAVLRDETGMIEVSWPGQPFLDRTIDKGDVLLVSGNVRFFHGRQLQPREYVNLGADEHATAQGRVLSVYPATEGLSFKVIRSIIDAHLDALLPLVTEYLPPGVLKAADVPGIGEALRMMHRPSSLAEAMRGRSRLAFEELFFVHLLHQRAKDLAREHRAGIRFENKRKLTTALREALPFQLTGAQARAIREIVADMCSDRRMQRLLQGDVGSGKTIVALFAAMLAIENGRQAAIMVPTELLAEQHVGLDGADCSRRSASSRCC